MKKLPYNVTNKYTKLEYNPEGTSKEEGMNCLSMAIDFCKEELDLDYDFGSKITDEISWNNVSKLFNEKPNEVFKEVEKYFLKGHFELIPPHQMRKGDIISVDAGPNDVKVPCVFAGNNKILVTTKEGMKVVSLKGKRVFDVYRIKEPKKITTKAVYKLNELSNELELIKGKSYNYEGDIAECEVSTWIAVIGLIISLISAVYTYFNMPEDQNSSYQGTIVNTRSTKEPLKTAYGTIKIGGNDVYYASINQYHKDLYIIQTLSEGEIESIEEVFIDNQPLSYYSHYTGQKADYQFYNGSATQTYDTTINSIEPSFTDNMRHTAYIRWHFLWNRDLFPTGEPQRFATIKGKKVLDFRDDTTAWSNNAVLCMYDFFTNGRYGLNVPTEYIDITSWTTAANYMDTKGWEFNYVTNGSNNPWTTIQEMMKHFRGSISYFDGMYYLLFADLNYESSVMTIEDKHIVQDGEGRAQIRLVQPSRFDKPKGLKCMFLDEDKEYTKDEVLVGDAEGVIQNINMFGYTNRATVGKLANYQLERLRLNRTISGTFRDDCLELAPHDLITFNSTALAISDQPMRVASTSFAGNGLINLSLQYESEDLYDDVYSPEIEGVYTCNLPNPAQIVSVENPQVSEQTFHYGLRTESRLHITFTVSDDEPWFDHCEVWTAIVSAGAPSPSASQYEHQFNTTNDFNIDHVEQNQVYYIVLVPVSIYNVKEQFSIAPKLSHTVTGNSAAPESLTFLSAIPSNNSLTLYSNKKTDPDIEIYEFRIGTQWQGGVFLSAKRSPNEQLPGVKPGTHTFLCNTRGTNDLYGTSPQSATATISEPVGWSLNNTWTDDYTVSAGPSAGTFNNSEHTIYASEDYLMCSHSGSLSGSYFTREFDTGELAAEYYTYVDADIVVSGVGTTWNDVMPSSSPSASTWDDINISIRNWSEIFTVDEAPRVDISTFYRETSGAAWSEVPNQEILSAIITARYFKIKITIIDPTDALYAKVEHLTFKIYTKT